MVTPFQLFKQQTQNVKERESRTKVIAQDHLKTEDIMEEEEQELFIITTHIVTVPQEKKKSWTKKSRKVVS